MADFEVKNFRIKPVVVKIGEKETEVVLHDLAYEKQQDLVKKISKIILQKDTLPSIIENLPAAIERELLSKSKSPEQALGMFIDSVVKIYDQLNNEQILELLEQASDGKINAKVIEESKVGGAELIGLLDFIVKRQLEPLKNFNASLSSILSNKTK